jgi:hypothetical protein
VTVPIETGHSYEFKIATVSSDETSELSEPIEVTAYSP